MDSNPPLLKEGLHFELQAQCPTTGARAGLIHTPHGTIETPVFMPVGTQGTVKGLTPAQLEHDLDAKIILANTLIVGVSRVVPIKNIAQTSSSIVYSPANCTACITCRRYHR